MGEHLDGTSEFVVGMRQHGDVSILLFSSHDLSGNLEATMADVRKRLNAWDAEALLKAPEHDVIEELVEQGFIRCPVLLRGQAWMTEPTEVEVEEHYFNGTTRRTVPALTLVVPFDGEKEVFLCRPSTFTMNPPRVEQLSTDEVRIMIRGELNNSSQARRIFDQEMDAIDKHLAWARGDIDRYNTRLSETVPTMVAQRRAQLLAVRELQAGIGFPIQRRPDAGSYSVPVTRRAIRPARAPRHDGRPFAPEPVLTEKDYEETLQVLIHQRNALERSPAVAAGMDEETIRDLLLVGLNSQFEGAAAGEVFNGAGKTDILIRERDRNIFIGECKVWKGPKTAEQALSQLFDYLVWRDTKAALLLFIRNKNVTAAVKAAVEKIEAHPNFKRRGTHDGEDRIDFVMHAHGDAEREIKLALLPFALPGGATSRFNRS